MDAGKVDDLAFLANPPDQAESLLYYLVAQLGGGIEYTDCFSAKG